MRASCLKYLTISIAMTSALVTVSGFARAEALPETANKTQYLDSSSIQTAVGKVTAELREGYVFPDEGKAAAATLEKALAANAYDGLTDPAAFAKELTEVLQAATKDSHMRVVYGSPFKNRPAPTTPQDAGFEVERLEHNVGYIRLSKFVPPDTFNPAADAALSRISDTSALIIDMQDNGGGHPASVAYFASFFFDPAKPIHINSLVWRNRGSTTFRTESFWTSRTPVQYLDKPVYVLVGPKTYSAGEEFAYDLQVLKRATVVGAKTRGGANPGGLTEIGPDLFVVVPTGRAENPTTQSNWEGVGVVPDVSISPDAARQTAMALASGQPASK